MGKIRDITLTGLLALVSTGCASDERNKSREIYCGPNPQIIPVIREGPYAGMGYIIINPQIAKEQGIDQLIEIRDVESGESLTVIYDKDGSIKNHRGNLEYLPEAVEQIRKKDTNYKSDFFIKIK